MRDREIIEKDVPTDLPAYDENYDIIGHRNNQKILTAILEVLLDIRGLLWEHNRHIGTVPMDDLPREKRIAGS